MQISDFVYELVKSENYNLRDYSKSDKAIDHNVQFLPLEVPKYKIPGSVIIQTYFKIIIDSRPQIHEGTDIYSLSPNNNPFAINSIAKELIYQSYCRNAGYIYCKYGLELIKSIPNLYQIYQMEKSKL